MAYNIIIGRNESDRKKFGDKGVVFIGKSYVKMGRTTSLSNKMFLDIVRSHVVLVCGKRGSGKCLHGDTLIQLDNGLQIPIKELRNNKNNVCGLNNELKIQSLEKNDFFEREVNKIIHLKLRSGREIKLTPEHPLLTIEGWVPVKDLSLNDRIAVPRRIEISGEESLEGYKIKLLAYLIAEGHLSNGFVLFSNNDQGIIKEFDDIINRFDENLRVDEHSKPGCYRVSQINKKYRLAYNQDKKGRFTTGSGVRYEKSSIRKWLEELSIYDKLSKDKFVPEIIFKLKKDKIALFLNRLFSCDGSIYPNKSRNDWEIDYSSSSERLIRQVQNLLLRFEILSRLRKKKIKFKNKIFDTFELVLNGQNVAKFIKEIGFFGEKEKKQEEALKYFMSIITKPNIDTIPKEIWEFYRPDNWAAVGMTMHYKYQKALRTSINYAPTRQKLLQIAEVDNAEQIRLLATSDIFWDEIIGIELLEGNFKVYDISVPEFHNFIANDMIVHNSYTLGVISEGICNLPKDIAKNLSIIIFDTMGIFWTMKYANEKDADLLKNWGQKPEGLEAINIYIPKGYFNKHLEEGIPADHPFSIKPSELTAEDWRLSFSLEPNDPVAIAIEKTIYEFSEKEVTEYSVDDLLHAISEDKEIEPSTKNAAKNYFRAAKGWGLFDEEGTKIKDLIQGGKVSVIDLSAYTTGAGGWGVKSLVTGLVSKRLFLERTIERKKEEVEMISAGYSYLGSEEEYKKEKKPMVWLVIDECLPYNSEIITDKAHTPIGDIVKRFKKGESFKVLGYDVNNQKYDYYDVYHVYEKGKREILEITTETGRKIKTTPNHKVLTDKGFQYALEAKKLATPLNQHYSTNKKSIRARLFGHILGDGWVSKKTKSVGFAGNGNIDDLEKIKEDLLELGFSSSSIHTRKTSSEITTSTGKKLKVNGTSQQLTASVRAFDYFSKLNPPIGKKVHSNFLIPSWLLNATNGEKAEFLAALFGSDGQAPSADKNVKSDFNAIRLSFYKLECLENNANEYANQIKELFNDLDIQVSNIRKRVGNVTKKGEKTIRVDLTLAKSVENTIKFLEKVGYRYCKEKEDKCKRWLNYLRARQFVVNQRKELRDKALRLHKPGFGKVRIGKKLNLPAYQVREWIYYKTGAGMPKNFPSFEEWTKRKCADGVVYEEIIEKRELEPELVYDIAVKDVHNFVANDFIVHNCHEFLPETGKTAATDALITVLREGRQPGVSTLLATQQPGKIHKDVMTQTDIVISHRVTARPDVEALNNMMQSYMTTDLVAHLNNLPRESGAAIILDDNSERIYPMRVRPRFTWHGGEAPTAITYKKKLDLGL